MPRAEVVPGVTVESDSVWDANRHLNKDQVDARVRFYEDLGSPGKYLTPSDLIDAFPDALHLRGPAKQKPDDGR